MAEGTWIGRRAATLEVVIEAAGQLIRSQQKGFGVPAKQALAPSRVAGLSQRSTAVTVQLPMVVAT